MITLDKLTGRENYQSWADSVDLWFIRNDCEDYLTIADTNIPENQRPQWRTRIKISVNTDISVLGFYVSIGNIGKISVDFLHKYR